MELNIKLESIEKVKQFVRKAESLPYNIDIISGRYIVDAKSILGIFSLNLSNTLKMTVHADEDDCEEFGLWLKENGFIA